MTSIAITGGAGFVGSQLGYAFHNLGYQVKLIDNMSYGKLDNLLIDGKTFGEFIGMDIRSPNLVNVFKDVDYVFHFAAIAPLPECQTFPYGAIDNNVSGTANVLEAARLNGVKKVIFASTSAIYENNSKFPLEESDETKPSLIYATTKKQSEQLCESFNKCYGLDYTILRFFNVYGPHQDFRRKQPPLIGYIIKQLLLDEKPILHSDGEQKRDYIYIDDVVSICKEVMTDPKSSREVFNVASGNAYSVKEIYEIIARRMDKSIHPVYRSSSLFWDKYPNLKEGKLPLKEEILEKEVNKFSLGSNQKAKEILGWAPLISLEEGLNRSVDYAVTLGV